MRLLFVCLGNICRSPAAHGVAETLAAAQRRDWHIASAGTGAWHAGEPPDQRMITAAAARGLDLSPLRARQAIGALNQLKRGTLDWDNKQQLVACTFCSIETHKLRKMT